MTTKELNNSAKRATQKAVSETFSKGLPITVQRGKKIVKVFPDGKEVVITKLDRAYIKAGKKEFDL